WYVDVAGNQLHPVGQLKPNDRGLFDILGNGLEWCQDPYQRYNHGPHGQVSMDEEFTASVNNERVRVLRGGTFHFRSSSLRSANRSWEVPSNRFDTDTFRPARTCP